MCVEKGAGRLLSPAMPIFAGNIGLLSLTHEKGITETVEETVEFLNLRCATKDRALVQVTKELK